MGAKQSDRMRGCNHPSRAQNRCKHPLGARRLRKVAGLKQAATQPAKVELEGGGETAAGLGVSLSTITHSHGSENDGKATAMLPPSEIPLTPMPPTRGEPPSWVSYRDARFGFALEYPTEVFIYDRSQSNDGQSSNFVSRDGRARLVIFTTANLRRKTLAQHRRSLVEGPYKDAAFDYTPQRSSWFVLSGTQNADMFYERVTLTCETRRFHGWKLVYPVSERKFYDRIVEEVHRRYRHSNRAGEHCG